MHTETTAETVGELQQRTRSETGEEIAEGGWLLVLPAGTEIDTGDAVIVSDGEFAGAEFEVDGDPWHARAPWSQLESHVECSLKLVSGRAGGES